MQNIKHFLKKAAQTITEKTNQGFKDMENNVQQIQLQSQIQEGRTSIVGNENQAQPLHQSNNKVQQNQKVLEIDVIQSGYLLKSEQQIKKEPQVTQSHHSIAKQSHQDVQNSGVSRLKQIQNEKQSILDELRKLDEEIAQIKGQNIEDGALKRRQKEQQQEEANKQAKGLVKQLKQQKRQIEQRRRKETEKALLILKQQQEQRKAKEAQQKERMKEEKRRKIQARMQEQKRKRQQRRQIEKQSNRLLKQLKKEEIVLKQKEEIPQQTGQIEQKKKVFQKRNEVNFRQIEEHQRKYIQMKQNQRTSKKQRSQSVNHQAPQYKKNMWLQQLEEQEQKRKQQEQNRQAMRKGQLDKRKKYGELVKNIFVPKAPKKEKNQSNSRQKLATPDANLLPRIPQSQKRVTDSKQMKKFTQHNRPFATAHNPKPPRPQKLQKKQSEDLEAQKQKKAKEAQMRRQTRDRLKKLENKSIDLPKSLSKPKYENYLGRVNVKADSVTTSWKKIIDNESISKEDKYKEMLRRAAAMENKAKVKEEVKKDGDEQAVNLYIGSIQAKLAILQKF